MSCSHNDDTKCLICRDLYHRNILLLSILKYIIPLYINYSYFKTNIFIDYTLYTYILLNDMFLEVEEYFISC
jgi:hypothetical protein